MSNEFTLNVGFTPLCTSCGLETQASFTQGEPGLKNKVFVSACENCFMFKPLAQSQLRAVGLLQRIYTECDERDEGKGGRISVELMEELRRFVEEMQRNA